MKTIKFLAGAIICLFLLVMACERNESVKPGNDQQSAKMEQLKSMGVHQLKGSGPLNYIQRLCPDEILTGDVPKYSISNSDAWDYYMFYGIEGQNVNIKVVRIDCEMDPSFSLFFGTSESTVGVEPEGSSNPDLEYLVFRDDQMARPGFCEGYCYSYGDPGPEVTLPYTGWYTLGVYDFFSCGEATGPFDYSLVVTGIPYCTIVIDGCDTQVRNQTIGDDTMQELIDQCQIDVKNHGAYVKRVAQLTELWFDNGLITMEEKDAIVACAAESGYPYL